MDAATANMDLPPEVAAVARDSVGGAVDAAASMGGQAGQALADAAHTAFLHAFSGSLFLAAGVVAVAAILAFVYLPAQAGDAREDEHSPLDGIASMIFAAARACSRWTRPTPKPGSTGRGRAGRRSSGR